MGPHMASIAGSASSDQSQALDYGRDPVLSIPRLQRSFVDRALSEAASGPSHTAQGAMASSASSPAEDNADEYPGTADQDPDTEGSGQPPVASNSGTEGSDSGPSEDPPASGTSGQSDASPPASTTAPPPESTPAPAPEATPAPSTTGSSSILQIQLLGVRVVVAGK